MVASGCTSQGGVLGPFELKLNVGTSMLPTILPVVHKGPQKSPSVSDYTYLDAGTYCICYSVVDVSRVARAPTTQGRK